MAEALKRQHDLVVLEITLLADEDPAMVRFELETTEEDPPRRLGRWTVPTEELGLPATLDPAACRDTGYLFSLPDHLVDGIDDALPRAGILRGHSMARRPLWLHLTRPAGHLALVNWEELLVPLLQVPVLRLPDQVVEPVRSRQALDVVLCADDPYGEAGHVAEQATLVLEGIVDAASLPTTVRVFADPEVHALLRAEYRTGRPGHRVLFHDPAGAPGEDDLAVAGPGDLPGVPPNPWLQWMRNELSGRSVDVVHFLAPGNLLLNQGGLALSAAPGAPGVDVVPTAAITRLALQLGAWGCAFSSPLGNRSEMGLRLAADTVGQLRPGALLHHELRRDPLGMALANAYQFLTAVDPAPLRVNPATFLYCQPFQVATEPGVHEPAAQEQELEPGAEVRELLTGEATPSWVAAAQRYVEQYRWRLQRWEEGPGIPPPELRAGVYRALQEIQQLADRHAHSPPNATEHLHISQVTAVSEPPEETW